MTNPIEKVLSRFLWAFLVFASLSACGQEPDKRLHADGKGWKLEQAVVIDKKRPRVLLVGDSILNGYKNQVVKAVEGKVNVDAWVNLYQQSKHLNYVLLPAVLADGPSTMSSISTSACTPVTTRRTRRAQARAGGQPCDR